MAISGAAANPQYGLRTNRSAAFLFGLLNARVGVWMDNPRRTTGKRPWTPHWPMYLFFDLFSATTERRRLVNVSDGGHIENLGVYELLKRRCSLIVASDASADLIRRSATSAISSLPRESAWESESK